MKAGKHWGNQTSNYWGPEPVPMTTAKSPQMGVLPAQKFAGFRRRLPELATFGGVGAIAFVVDIGIYNLLLGTVLADKTITAKVFSVIAATIVAWLGNRFVTFRARGGRPVFREAALFAASNAVGLLISALCLFVSHYVLGFTSQLADNIAANVIGLGLGTAFRYVTYRSFVFRTPAGGPAS